MQIGHRSLPHIHRLACCLQCQASLEAPRLCRNRLSRSYLPLKLSLLGVIPLDKHITKAKQARREFS